MRVRTPRRELPIFWLAAAHRDIPLPLRLHFTMLIYFASILASRMPHDFAVAGHGHMLIFSHY